MASTVNLIWQGPRPLPAGYADIISNWHTQNPDPPIVIWMDADNPDYNACKQSFQRQPRIKVDTAIAMALSMTSQPGSLNLTTLTGLGFDVRVH